MGCSETVWATAQQDSQKDEPAMTNLKKISIDGIEVEVNGAMTIIQAAE
jgi:hypothetical protein